MADQIPTAPPNPIFSSAMAQIQADLQAMPASVDLVVVSAVDEKGVTAGVAKRLGDGGHWKLSAAVEKRWNQQRPGARLIVTRER